MSGDAPVGIGQSNTNATSSALAADYQLLFIGNSHSSKNGLPYLVSRLIEIGDPDKEAKADLAPGWRFLDERLSDGVTKQTLEGRAWTHVILQAQKYSSSGRYHYPTHAAQTWIRRAASQRALPILFPEWPRKGNVEEGPRVHRLHQTIAASEGACVAPVGITWDAFIKRHPNINLYARDGNHSNLNGAFLSALVFYLVITGNHTNQLRYVSEIDVSEALQRKMRDVVSLILIENPACTQGKASIASM